VTLPAPDPELEAAGFGGRPPAGIGERAWLLRQLIAHVRPSRWTEWLGAVPRGLVARALRSDDSRPVLEGWAEAARRFGDADWLAALLTAPKVTEINLDLRSVVAQFPEERRMSVIARVAPAADAAVLAWLAPMCPPVWPAPVADAVLEAMRGLAGDQYPDQRLYDLARAAAIGLAPDREGDLTAVASHDGQIRPSLAWALDTLRHRARIHAAFASLPMPERD
jgi:hypothetical protein